MMDPNASSQSMKPVTLSLLVSEHQTKMASLKEQNGLKFCFLLFFKKK